MRNKIHLKNKNLLGGVASWRFNFFGGIVLDYEEAIAYIQHLCTFGIKPGLARIERLLALLGNPEAKLKCIHVAGTNGKGSTSALIAAVLQDQGYRVGVYSSPHLQSYRERFVINGGMIEKSEFARLLEMLRPRLAQVRPETDEQPTEFEVLTAMAFQYFHEHDVDVALIEAGLGGTWDSTNVITPLVAVITNVSFDHMDRLGDTLAEIAGQKAGIIKPGVPVVTAAADEALAVIKSMASAKDAPLIDVGRYPPGKLVSLGKDGQTFHLTTAGREYRNLRTALLGPHQMMNGLVALAVCEQLQLQGIAIGEKAIYQGFSQARWPGRFEIISRAPLIVLDGAHNPDGARTLRATFASLFPGCEAVFVVGILADKDYAQMLKEFSALAKVIILTAPDSPRAADPALLAATVDGCETIVQPDLREAVAAGVRLAGTEKILCVCGSLYLVGQVRDMLANSQTGLP